MADNAFSFPKALGPFLFLATMALLVAIFSRAQVVLVPIALALVIAFLLTPLVKALERRRVRRSAAITLVMLLALFLVGACGYVLSRQVVDLSHEMATYAESMRKKVAALRGSNDGLASLRKTVDKVAQALDEKIAEQQAARPVRVVPDEASALERFEATVEPVLAPIAAIVIVFVLVIFMLAQREDLRNRFIRLVGKRKLSLTTRTLDEAGQKISRFLIVQTVINAGFGLLTGLGLFAIGIPHAVLWGFAAGILRFIPFIGAMLAVIMPTLLAFALFDGWSHALATLALFTGLDMITAYAVEPLIIGRRIGVSSMALLVAAIFWTWLWGPIGLVLSVPFTVCLAVLGRQVPQLEFLGILLGDGRALDAELAFYQRLLAHDEDEAHDIVDEQLRNKPRAEVFDAVLVPALLMAENDKARGEISDDDRVFMLRTIRQIVRDSHEPKAAPDESKATSVPVVALRGPPQAILGYPTRHEADELLLEMIVQQFDPTTYKVHCVTSKAGATELDLATEPALICLATLPPGGILQSRYLCRSLRQRFPNSRIMIVRPGLDDEAQKERLARSGSDRIVSTLTDAQIAAEQLLASRATATTASPSAGEARRLHS